MAKTKEKTPSQILSVQFDDTLARTVGSATYKQLRALRKDPTIALARQLSIAPILAAPWSIEATKDAPDGAKEFIDVQMAPLRMHILRTGFLGCTDFGWQSFEKVFELLPSRQIGIKKLKPLLHDISRLLVDRSNGALLGIKQTLAMGNDITLSTDEVLVLYIDVEGTNWYGQGLLEIVKSTQDDWDKANDVAKKYDNRIAGAHWVVSYPEGTAIHNGKKDVDNFEIASDLLNTLESSGKIAMPTGAKSLKDSIDRDLGGGWSIDLLDDGGPKQFSMVARMKYLDALKVRAFGMPERAILEGQFGTKSEAEQHADMAIINMEVRHKVVVQLVNWHLVNQLLRFNYGPEAENTVFISPAPIVDLVLEYIRSVYSDILKSPDGILVIADIDVKAMEDQLGIPSKESE
ncbi:hypothetical protein LCGC14_0356980 [marine sediment metagenome]|uniref:Uncharacterized protein n=1 Tax=marine sediment metagenome TaxID=412755 RepID=A0A0F9TEM4_9ZZZZ